MAVQRSYRVSVVVVTVPARAGLSGGILYNVLQIPLVEDPGGRTLDNAAQDRWITRERIKVVNEE
jgi:hypothetical protein